MNHRTNNSTRCDVVEFRSTYSVQECINRIRDHTAQEKGFFSYEDTRRVVSKLEGNRVVLRRNCYSLAYHRNIVEGTAFQGEVYPTSDGTCIAGEFVTHNSKPLNNPVWDKTILRGLILLGIAFPLLEIIMDAPLFLTRTNLIFLFGFYLSLVFFFLITLSSSRAWKRERSETMAILSEFLQKTLDAS